jgi:galactokinase
LSSPLSLPLLCDIPAVTGLLVSRGVGETEAAKKAQMFESCAETLLRKVGADAETTACFVPGRIEVLGKHTDYAGGRSLVVAVEKAFCFVAAARGDAKIRAFDVAGKQKCEFEISDRIEPRLGHWSNYPQTLARRVAQNFGPQLAGVDVAFLSDLPIASGMSSSSAMMVGFFLILSAVNKLADRPEYKANIESKEDLAAYLGTAENGQTFGSLEGDKGVGTFGGSEDHTAMLCCEPAALSLYSYCPARFEQKIKMPERYLFCVASSGVVAEKTGNALRKYNRASGLCRCALETYNEATASNYTNLAEALSNDTAEHIRQVLAASSGKTYSARDLLNRFEHFYLESEEIIPAASRALAAGDIEHFGTYVLRSQRLAEMLLANQVSETIFLAARARAHGAVAASAFGAGFGGSVWAMAKAENVEKFIRKWRADYEQHFPKPAEKAEFLITRAGPAAFLL